MESLLTEMLESHEADDGSEDIDNIEEKEDKNNGTNCDIPARCRPLDR